MDNGSEKKEGRWARKRRLKREKQGTEEKAVYRKVGRLKLQKRR